MDFRPGDSIAPPIQYVDRQVNALEMPPEVSIILPAYNAHNTIKRTIASICMQENVDEIEIIIADDCSDEPYDHIAELFAHMVRIRVVRMLKNGGPGAARQVGFDHSVGQYIMYMDADDTLVAADSIKVLKNVMIQKEMDCVYGRFLEQSEDGSIHPHEVHMVWMFSKLYRRSFLEKYNIRFNTSLSNEDTGFNCVVKGCSERIWYIPKDIYIWHFKPNSITRIKQGMYGQDSGYKGYIDNMIWQILELEKRFVNKNYILSEIVAIMCVLYHFHVENMQQCPLNTDVSMNWIRGYYDLVFKPHEDVITETMLMNTFAQVAAGQNIAAKGIIPKITFEEFMKQVRAEPYTVDIKDEVRGSTPAGYVPPITDPDWPVKITDYFNYVERRVDVDNDTNFSRYGGMKKVLGIEQNEKDYDTEYTGKGEGGVLKHTEGVVNRTPYGVTPTEPIRSYNTDTGFNINESLSQHGLTSSPACKTGYTSSTQGEQLQYTSAGEDYMEAVARGQTMNTNYSNSISKTECSMNYSYDPISRTYKDLSACSNEGFCNTCDGAECGRVSSTPNPNLTGSKFTKYIPDTTE